MKTMRVSILVLCAFFAVSCTSVTVHDKGGRTINVANVFGQGSVANVTAGDVTISGFQSDHTLVTKDAISANFWKSFWGSKAAGKLATGAASLTTSTGNALEAVAAP